MIVIDFEQQKAKLPYITSKEIYVNGNVEKFHPDGLYSEVHFGPKTPWKCTCGTIDGSSYEGETCEICGVTISDGSQRSKQYAKIKLPKRVLWPMFSKHIQTIFGVKAIKDIFNPAKYNSNVEDPYYFDIMTCSLKKKKAIKNFENYIFKTMPVYDIASLYELYKHMCQDPTLSKLVKTIIDEDYIDFVFTDEIVVTPPSSRPVITTGTKKDIPDISKHYKSLLALCTNTFWTNPKNSDEEFNKNIYNFQKIMDEMEEFTFNKLFLSKTSVMRDASSGSTVEFSSRCVIVPEPALAPYAVALPREVMLKNTMPDFLHFILKNMENLKETFLNDPTKKDIDIQQMIQMVRAGNTNFPVDNDLFRRYLESSYVNKKFMIERAPVLWRFNFSGVVVSVVLFEDDGYKDFKIYVQNYNGPKLANTDMYNNKVMMVNTTVAGAFNFDFDGDSMSIFALHSIQAQRDWFSAFLGNGINIEFEHNNNLIPVPEHEAVYAMYALTEAVKTFNLTLDDVPDLVAIELKEFYYDFNTLNKNPMKPVLIQVDSGTLILLPYSIVCINRVLGFNYFKVNPGEMAKKDTKKVVKDILTICGKTGFYDVFHELNKFLLWCSTAVSYCNPTFDLGDFAISSQEIKDYKDTLINEPYIGFHQNDILFSDYVKPEIAKNPKNSLHRVFKSDARIKSVQLLKAASNSGIPTDIHGKAFINNIKEDLLYGHTKEGFYQSGDSARLALAQRQEAIPKGGELQRRFFYILGFLKLSRTEDCGSKSLIPIEIISKDHLESLYGRYYIQDHKKFLITQDSKPEDFIGKTLNFRWPGGCEHPGYKICNCCFGTKQPQSANLGAAVGSYISESIIQSVLRTHHFSGAFITNIRKPILELIKRNRFQSPNMLFVKLENQMDLEELNKFYLEVYGNTEDVRVEYSPANNTETETAWEIRVINAPYNDDSVKKLNNIIQVIDKDRSKDKLLPITEMYKKLLDEIILPNGILSIYVELVMSILYFDENGVMCRYGGEPDHQIALKNIIKKCDPRLGIHYNFNKAAVSQILKDSKKILGAEHMYSDMLKLYDK